MMTTACLRNSFIAVVLLVSTFFATFAAAQVVHVDLVPLGWLSVGGNANGQPLLYNALAFSEDNSLWVLYPNEGKSSLVPRGGQSVHFAKIAHLSPQGTVLRTCQVGIPAWFRTQLFVNAAGEPIVEANATFQLMGANCEVIHTITLTGTHPLRSYLSSSGDKLFVVVSEGKLIALDASTLQVKYEVSIPIGVRAGEYTAAENVAAYSASRRAEGGCGVDNVVKQEIVKQVTTPWASLPCSDFVAITDHLLLAKKRDSQGETLSLLDDHGNVKYSFKSPPGSFIDTPSFFLRHTGGTSSSRVVEHFFFKKGDAISIGVIDFPKDELLFTVKIGTPGSILSSALSSDGHHLAVYSGSAVEIHELP